jgi:hypothetical protein
MHFECGALPNTKETVLINRESDAVTCIGMYVLLHFECGALPNTKETVLINRESDAVTCIGMYVLLRQHSLDMI